MLKPVMVALAAFVLGGLCQRAFAEPEFVAASSYQTSAFSD